jgi:hypothetical protein
LKLFIFTCKILCLVNQFYTRYVQYATFIRVQGESPVTGPVMNGQDILLQCHALVAYVVYFDIVYIAKGDLNMSPRSAV